MIIKHGDIYYADMPKGEKSEQNGRRPVIIIQNDRGNENSPNVTVITVTSRMKKRSLPTHVLIKAATSNGLDCDSIAQGECIHTISKTRLRNYIGQLNDIERELVGRATDIQLGRNRDKEERALTRKEEFYVFDENKVRTSVQSILELEKLLDESYIKNNNQALRSITTSIKLQYKEFIDYCNLHHKKVERYYRPRYFNITNDNLILNVV